MIILFPVMQDELCEDNFNMSKQPIILREEPDNYNSYRPPNYYGSGRMDEVMVIIMMMMIMIIIMMMTGVLGVRVPGQRGLRGQHH